MTINLWADRELETQGANAGTPSLTPYLLDGAGPHPVVIVAPGGGYTGRAPHEGEPVAKWLNSIGVSTFVLNYRVSPFEYPTQLQDAQRAIRLVRSRAAEWRVDPRRVGILGFSAGGHLVSTAGTHYDLGDSASGDAVERFSSRPDLMVLCYPVVTLGNYTHEGSRTALLGSRAQDAELIALLSNEQQVTPDTPPAFLWHTANDAAVPVENSLQFAAALSARKVPFEMHIFEQGAHGLGLAQDFPGAQAWPELLTAWLERRRFIGNLPRFDLNSTVGELRRDARALAVLRKHLSQHIDAPDFEQADGLPLRLVAGYLQIPEEQLLIINAELAEIEE